MKRNKSSGTTIPRLTSGDEILRLLFHHHPIPMWVYNLETLAFLEVNESAVKIYGYTRKEFLRMTLNDILPVEDVQRVLTNAAKKKMKLQPPGEWRHKLKNGHILDVEITSHTVTYDGCNAILVTAMDVTKRKRAEEALRASETQYRHLIETMQDGVYRSSHEGKFLEVNPAMVKILGYDSKEDLMAIDIKSQLYFATEDRESAALDEKRQEMAIFRLRKKDGSEIWVEDHGRHVVDDGGRVLYHEGVLRDVTERKRTEDTLRGSEKLFRQAQTIAGLGGYVLDIAKGMWNSTDVLDRIFGIDQAYLRSVQGWVDLVHPQDRREMVDYFTNEVLGKGKRFDKEYRIVRKNDNAVRWVHGMGELEVGAQGQIIKMRGTIQDITGRKQAEEALRESEEKFRTIFNESPIGIELYNADGTQTNANRASLDMFGIPDVSEIRGFNIFDGTTLDDGKKEQLRRGKPVAYQAVFDFEKVRKLQQYKTDKIGKALFDYNIKPLLDTESKTINGYLLQVQDVTKRKRAEEALRASETQYRHLIETMQDGVYRSSHEGKFLEVNPAMVKILGYDSKEDLMAIDIKSQLYFATEDRESAALDEKRQEMAIFRLRKKDGSEIWVEDHGRHVVDDGGRVLYHEGVLRDVTERMRVEEALQKSEQRYRDIVAHAPVGIYQSTMRGDFVTVNARLAEILGYASVDELMQKNLSRDIYLHEEERKSVISKFEPVGSVQNLEVRWKRKDGSPVWISLSSHLVRGGDDTGAYFEGFVRDITEHKRTELEKNVSSEITQGITTTANLDELFHLIHQSLKKVLFAENCFIALQDPATGLFSFPYFADQFDTPPPPQSLEKTCTGYVFRTGQPMLITQRDFEQLEKQGEVASVGTPAPEWLGAPLRTPSKTIGVVAVQQYEEKQTYTRRDIEFLSSVGNHIAHAIERKQAEEIKRSLESQLQQAQKLESLGTLAGGIAHDFNNILSIIIGHATLLERLPPERSIIQKNADAITKASVRGAGLVKQLLTFARKADVLFESITLNDIVNDVSRLLAETFPKTITVALNLGKALPFIEADATQVHQVMLNLCLNARDAMPSGGTLTITTLSEPGEALRHKRPEATAREYVVLGVADTGMGMDENTQRRIFEPFFTTKEHGKGTGLGLALVFGIMESHNGFVTVHSQPGKGTSFKCYFPASRKLPEIGRVEERAIEKPPGGHETILVVEDEEMLRDLLETLLVTNGYTVLTAGDGENGLALFTEHQKEIGMVISDLGLPKFGGDELYRRLKLLKPQVLLIIASGYIRPELKSEVFKLGVKAFIQKPYNASEVLRLIRSVLDGK